MLLNAGRRSEFKGKSLAEIQVSGDVVDYDENVTEKHSSDPKASSSENFTETIDNSTATSSAEKCFDDSTEHSLCSVANLERKGSNIKRSGRIRWLSKEKNIVLKFFKKHIKNKTSPKKDECLALIGQHPNLFNESDWMRIKTLVYNTYRDK